MDDRDLEIYNLILEKTRDNKIEWISNFSSSTDGLILEQYHANLTVKTKVIGNVSVYIKHPQYYFQSEIVVNERILYLDRSNEKLFILKEAINNQNNKIDNLIEELKNI